MAIRVLLVEDEGLLRMVTADSLEGEGFAVVEARDGEEAVRLLNCAEAVDIILTDVQMPGSLDGIDVATHARQLYPMIPVLVVSGYAPRLMSRLTAFDPAAVFISKPYSMAEITDAVRHLASSI